MHVTSCAIIMSTSNHRIGTNGGDTQKLALPHFHAGATPTQRVDAVGNTDDGGVGETRFQHFLK